MKKYFLPICVQEYENWTSLNGVLADVAELEDVLCEQYGYEILTYDFIGGKVTEACFWNALSLLKDLPEDSQLILYYTGHGYCVGPGKYSYWIPSEGAGEKSGMRTGWIDSMVFIEQLSTVQCRQALLINDTCLSGQLIRNCCGMQRAMPEKKARIREVLSSCDETEVVFEPDDGAISLFVYHLTNLLRNNNGQLECATLIGDLKKRLSGLYKPLLQPLYNHGHETGSSFPFVKQESELSTAENLGIPQTYELCMNRGKAAFSRKQYETAARHFLDALKLAKSEQENFDAFVQNGRTYAEMSDYKTSLLCFQRADSLDVDPDVSFFFDLAMAECNNENYDDAERISAELMNVEGLKEIALFLSSAINQRRGKHILSDCIIFHIIQEYPNFSKIKELKKQVERKVIFLPKLLEEISPEAPLFDIYIQYAQTIAKSSRDWCKLASFYIFSQNDTQKASDSLLVAESNVKKSTELIRIAKLWDHLSRGDDVDRCLNIARNGANNCSLKVELAMELRREKIDLRRIKILRKEAEKMADNVNDHIMLAELFSSKQANEHIVQASKIATCFDDWFQILSSACISSSLYDVFMKNAIETAKTAGDRLQVLKFHQKKKGSKQLNKLIRMATEKITSSSEVMGIIKFIKDEIRFDETDTFGRLRRTYLLPRAIAMAETTEDCCSILKLSEYCRLSDGVKERLIDLALLVSETPKEWCQLAKCVSGYDSREAILCLKKAERVATPNELQEILDMRKRLGIS